MLKFINPMHYRRWIKARRDTARDLGSGPLNLGQERAAVARWVAYSRARKLLGSGYPVIPYVGDAVLAWPKGASSVAMQAKFGLGEFYDQAFCLHMLRPDDLFCDVGANAGVYTVLASKVIGCRSVAIEPVPKTFALLMQNVWANDIAALVDARQRGVGREESVLQFTSTQWSLNHVVDQPSTDTVDVPVQPLDEILAGRTPRVVKIDVEGFEGEVIAGARETFSNPDCSAVILEIGGGFERFGTTAAAVVDSMKPLGFKPFWYDPFTRSLAGVGEPGPGRFNQTFIRDRQFVEQRLKSARAFEIRGRNF